MIGEADKGPIRLLAQINEILDEVRSELHLAKAVQELLEFEERRGDKNVVSLIKYKIKFGSSHLVNPSHSSSTLKETYDLDVKVIILIVGGLFYTLLKLGLAQVFRALKSLIPRPTQAEKQKTN